MPSPGYQNFGHFSGLDSYNDHDEYFDLLDFNDYNHDSDTLSTHYDFQHTQPPLDSNNYADSHQVSTQHTPHSTQGLRSLVSSPAAINNYLNHHNDLDYPLPDPYSASTATLTHSGRSLPNHSHSLSTGNLDMFVPHTNSSYHFDSRPLPPSIPSSPSRHPTQVYGPREPPTSFSQAPNRRDNISSFPSSHVRITYQDLNKELPLPALPEPVLDKEYPLCVSDSADPCNLSDNSSFSLMSDRSSGTSHEPEKPSSTLPLTPTATSPVQSSLPKPLPGEVSPLQNYTRGHAASDPRYKSSINLPAQIHTFSNTLSNTSPSSNLDSSSDTISLAPSQIAPNHFPRRIQRSQTFSETSDESAIPPPVRSYSTFSKSFSGCPSTDSSFYTSSVNSSAIADDEDASTMLRLDLPPIPDTKSKLDPSHLSSRDFARCREPWMLSSICKWIVHLAAKEMTSDALSEALIALFRHTIPTLGWVAAERITMPLLETLVNCNFLSINTDTGIVFVHEKNSTTGVLTSIAGKGCYSPRNHKGSDFLAASTNGNSLILNHKKESGFLTSYHCYSSRCCRNIPYKSVLPGLKQALQVNDNDRVNWAKIWDLSDSDLANLDKKLIERQCAIQELIGTEEMYVRGLEAFLNVYGDHLAKTKPHMIPNQEKFWSDTFGCIPGLIESNDNQFLSYLKIRQAQQGPYISKIADVVLNWLKSAHEPYMARASTYSNAMRVIASEKGKNGAFTTWLDRAERDPRLSRQQKFDFLVASPFTRLCRYQLLFDRIRAATPPNSPEYHLWRRSVDECKSLVANYNRIYGEAEDISSLMVLEERIVFPKPEDQVDLRLWEPRRKIHHQGDVVRKGEYGLDYVDTHMILLDHYLILAKVKKGNLENYIVSKRVSFDRHFPFNHYSCY